MKYFFRTKRTLIIIILILIVLATILTLYLSKKDVREWIDIYILRKSLTENDIQTLNLNADKANQIYVYSKYIAMLNDKSLNLYNSYGESVTSINLNINTAIFDSVDKYLAIAEKDGKELCLMLDKTYLWSATTDNDILQVHVNRNGYVAVVTTDITHKSILILYNSEGKKIFTRYFATTRIVDASISNDNKNIVVGELDSSGAIIQSIIEIISVDNAKNDTENTIVFSLNADPGKLITNVEYQENEQISCIYDNSVNLIKNNNDNVVLKFDNEKITYVSNELKNNVVYVEERKEGLFNVSSNIQIINTTNNQKVTYELEDIAKEIYTKNNIIAVNVGTEIYFLNTNGWLIKKYSSNQEITNVKVSSNIAAIIYKDKVEIIDL